MQDKAQDACLSCPHCGKRKFVRQNDVYNHIKGAHGKRVAREYRDTYDDDEPSIADQLVEGILAASMGEPVAKHIGLMFPEEIAEARKRGHNDRR